MCSQSPSFVPSLVVNLGFYFNLSTHPLPNITVPPVLPSMFVGSVDTDPLRGLKGVPAGRPPDQLKSGSSSPQSILVEGQERLNVKSFGNNEFVLNY